jgi:hypothetical protein
MMKNNFQAATSTESQPGMGLHDPPLHFVLHCENWNLKIIALMEKYHPIPDTKLKAALILQKRK